MPVRIARLRSSFQNALLGTGRGQGPPSLYPDTISVKTLCYVQGTVHTGLPETRDFVPLWIPRPQGQVGPESLHLRELWEGGGAAVRGHPVNVSTALIAPGLCPRATL